MATGQDSGQIWLKFGFAQPHVQMVRIDPNTWTLAEQGQVWHENIAFLDADLSTYGLPGVGMETAFVGPDFFPSNAVGVWRLPVMRVH